MKDTDEDGGLMVSFLRRALVVVLLTVTMSACAAIAGIFKAGFWVGVVVAVIIVVLLFAIFGRKG
jgi:hypothetical protein